jgi:RNAse (barnase) inhibitor barstar
MVIDMDKLANKDFYNIIKNKVFIKPIGIHFWTTYLDIQDFQNITDLYEFIFKILDFSSDKCTYHSLGIAFFSRLNSLKN